MGFIETTEAAEKAGIQLRVFVSERLYREFIKPPEEAARLGQTAEKRLGDLLAVFRLFIKQKKPDMAEGCFEAAFRTGSFVTVMARLKYAAHNGEGGEPAIHIMLNDETCDE